MGYRVFFALHFGFFRGKRSSDGFSVSINQKPGPLKIFQNTFCQKFFPLLPSLKQSGTLRWNATIRVQFTHIHIHIYTCEIYLSRCMNRLFFFFFIRSSHLDSYCFVVSLVSLCYRYSLWKSKLCYILTVLNMKN
jgi:hypothetical protein